MGAGAGGNFGNTRGSKSIKYPGNDPSLPYVFLPTVWYKDLWHDAGYGENPPGQRSVHCS